MCVNLAKPYGVILIGEIILVLFISFALMITHHPKPSIQAALQLVGLTTSYSPDACIQMASLTSLINKSVTCQTSHSYLVTIAIEYVQYSCIYIYSYQVLHNNRINSLNLLQSKLSMATSRPLRCPEMLHKIMWNCRKNIAKQRLWPTFETLQHYSGSLTMDRVLIII